MMSSVNSHPHVMGDESGPISADYFKRAVLRAAPSRFTIEFLPPAKVGGSTGYSFGMRVCPVSRGDRSSISSRGSNSEYDVWRRWEDCLWFQEALEVEYQRSARQKRQRLQQGKGVKKNGFYMQDRASSWESLPPGPDPNSVAQDIHEYVPRLTKRGTIFRASLATVEARNSELQAFVEALFMEDQPALIKEMRTTRLVTDFFGYWQRDARLVSRKEKESAQGCRDSTAQSTFSSYFSTSSTLSLFDALTGHSPKSPKSPKSHLDSPQGPFLRARSSTPTERPHSVASSHGTETSPWPTSTVPSIRTIRRRALSVTSSESSSSNPDEPPDNTTVYSEPRIAEEVPIVFGHNPRQHIQYAESPSSVLHVLPEEHDDAATPVKQQEFVTPIRRQLVCFATGSNQRRNRNCQIFISPPITPPSLTPEASTAFDEPQSPASPSPLDRSRRESWATIDSTSVYLEGLNISLPTHRQSVASIGTFMTTNSADAVCPRMLPMSSNEVILNRPNPRASVPVSLSDFDMYAEIPAEEDLSSIYDAFPRPTSYVPERPEAHTSQFTLQYPKAPEHYLMVPPSPTTSVSTTFSSATVLSISTTTTSSSSSSDSNDNLSIKAAHNDVIIMLRVSRDAALAELRQRLRDKFTKQEGVPLSKDFILAVAMSRMNSPTVSIPPTSGGHPDLRIINSQGDWETVAYSIKGTKLTLHILDTYA